MKNCKRKYLRFTCLILLIGVVSCNSDDKTFISTINFPVKEGLEVFDGSKVYDGLILVNDASANRVYLMDKKTDI